MGPAGDVGGGLVQAVGLRVHLAGEGIADLLEHAAGVADQRFHRLPLYAGRLLLGGEQGVQFAHDAAPFFQQFVVALAALRHFLAQAADDFGGRLGRFRGGFDQARHGCFQASAQLGEVAGGGGFQLGEPRVGGFATRRFLLAQRAQLLADAVDQCFQAFALSVHQGAGGVLELIVMAAQGLAKLADQSLQCLLLLLEALPPALGGGVAGLLEALGDGGQAFLVVGPGLLLIVADPRQQGVAVGLEAVVMILQGGGHLVGQGLRGLLMFGQALPPTSCRLFGGGFEALGDPAQLVFGERIEALVAPLRLVVEALQGLGDHRAHAFRRQPAAVRQAGAQAVADGRRQLAIVLGGLLVEPLLVVGERAVELVAHLFQAPGQRLQAIHHGGEGVGLRPQRAERFLLLVFQGKRAQIPAQHGVQVTADESALAAAQGGAEPQHGGGGDTRDGGAEGQAEPGDGRRQRALHGGQVVAAFQGADRALQGDDHADEGAQQAQHHQQAGQVGRQHGPGQRRAFPVHAPAHGAAQGGGQLRQPALQGVAVTGRGLQLPGQPGAVGAEAAQLQEAEAVYEGDQQGGGEGHQVGAQKADCHPGHGGRAKQAYQCE